MKTKYFLPLICSVCLFAVSCEKDLNLYSEDVVSDAVFFSTPEDFKLYMNQFYIALPSFNTDDDMSDITKPSGYNSVSNSSYVPTPSDGVWDDSYAKIRNLNYGLEKCETVPDNLKEQITVYRAEAHFFRAMYYFKLLVRFGGVPLIDKVLNLDDKDYLYGKRSSREDITDFILKDLNEAIPALPLQSQLSSDDNGRVTKGAAQAFKARVALFEGTWRKYHGLSGAESLLTDAVNESANVMKSNEYELFDKRVELGDLSYKYYFTLSKKRSNPAGLTKKDQKETILANRYNEETRESPRYDHTYELSPTKKFADMFLDETGLPITHSSSVFMGYDKVESEYQKRDPRMDIFFVKPFERFWLFTQPMYNINWNDPDNSGLVYKVDFGFWTQGGYRNLKAVSEVAFPLGMDYPVIRYTEVLLINAEALFEKNGNISNAELDQTINKLRDRVGMVHLTNEHVTANGLDMKEEIRRERTIELSMEGFRFDDLRRWKTAAVEMSQPLRGVKYKGTQYETDPLWSNLTFDLDGDGYIVLESASKRKFSDKNYLFPLPTRQIMLNPNLEQNPGW